MATVHTQNWENISDAVQQIIAGDDPFASIAAPLLGDVVREMRHGDVLVIVSDNNSVYFYDQQHNVFHASARDRYDVEEEVVPRSIRVPQDLPPIHWNNIDSLQVRIAYVEITPFNEQLPNLTLDNIAVTAPYIDSITGRSTHLSSVPIAVGEDTYYLVDDNVFELGTTIEAPEEFLTVIKNANLINCNTGMGANILEVDFDKVLPVVFVGPPTTE